MALRRKAAVVEPVPEQSMSASGEILDALRNAPLPAGEAAIVRMGVPWNEAKSIRLDVTKASISAAAAISANPAQIAHIAVQIADAVIAELAKEKV